MTWLTIYRQCWPEKSQHNRPCWLPWSPNVSGLQGYRSGQLMHTESLSADYEEEVTCWTQSALTAFTFNVNALKSDQWNKPWQSDFQIFLSQIFCIQAYYMCMYFKKMRWLTCPPGNSIFCYHIWFSCKTKFMSDLKLCSRTHRYLSANVRVPARRFLMF